MELEIAKNNTPNPINKAEMALIELSFWSVLFVTHDVPLARKYMNNYLYLNHGTITQGKMSEFEGDYE